MEGKGRGGKGGEGEGGGKGPSLPIKKNPGAATAQHLDFL